MRIERTDKEMIFRLTSSTQLEELQDMADFLSFKDIAKKSKAIQVDVDQLVKKIKKGRWSRTKRKLGV